MKPVSLLPVAAVLLISLILSGCAANKAAQLRAAGDLGRASAGVTLERQPDACDERVPHIRIREGDELRSTLRRERAQLDLANDRLVDCYQFNDELRAGLSGR